MICDSQKKKYPEEACIVLSTMKSFAGKKDFFKKDWTDGLRKDYGYAQHINTNWDGSLIRQKLRSIYSGLLSNPKVKNIHFILDTHGGETKELVMSSDDNNYFNIALSNIRGIMRQRNNVKLYFDNWACFDADYIDINGKQINIYEEMMNQLGNSLLDRTYCKSIEKDLVHHRLYIPGTCPYKNVPHFGFDRILNYHLYNPFQYFPLKDYKKRQDLKYSGYYGGRRAKNKFLEKKEKSCGCGIF